MMPRPLLLLLACVAFLGCPEETTLETLPTEAFTVVARPAQLELSATPAFGDERGGGVFVDLAGRVVRVRANGEQGVLESHPQNDVLPGPADAVHALGPSNALVVTSRGFFVADQGWLIAPQWQAVLDTAGLRGTALGADGVAWLAHEQGLYRVAGGLLSEFKVDDGSLTDVTALAVAPTLDGPQGLWFARGGTLSSATPTSTTAFTVSDSTLSARTLGTGVTAMVGIGPSATSAGELWAITDESLLLFAGTSWRQFVLPAAPRRLLGAGRFAWLQAGDALYRYDADARVWAEAKGLEGAGALLSVDATGAAWVRVGAQTVSINTQTVPRVWGLFEAGRVFEGQLVVQAEVPATPEVSITWAIDDGQAHELAASEGLPGSGPMNGLTSFCLGGVELSGVLKPISFAALEDGWHTLKVTSSDGTTEATRKVAFEFLGAATAAISWDEDVKTLNQERCAKCHATGTEPELITYEQWKANAPAIAAAVRESRMPADGPLDSAGISLIVRWVNGGELP